MTAYINEVREFNYHNKFFEGNLFIESIGHTVDKRVKNLQLTPKLGLKVIKANSSKHVGSLTSSKHYMFNDYGVSKRIKLHLGVRKFTTPRNKLKSRKSNSSHISLQETFSFRNKFSDYDDNISSGDSINNDESSAYKQVNGLSTKMSSWNANDLDKITSVPLKEINKVTIDLTDVKPDMEELLSEDKTKIAEPSLSIIEPKAIDTFRNSISESIKNYDFTPEQEFDDSDPIYNDSVPNQNQGYFSCGKVEGDFSHTINGNKTKPTIHEQLTSLFNIKQDGRQYFAISSKWWRKWGDYVNLPYGGVDNVEKLRKCLLSHPFVQNDGYVDVEIYETNEIQEITLKDISDDDSFLGISSLDSTRSYIEELNSSQIYKEPGKIKNYGILSNVYELILEDGTKVGTIKDNLGEMYDYIKVQQPVWQLLSEWYSYDYGIYTL